MIEECVTVTTFAEGDGAEFPGVYIGTANARKKASEPSYDLQIIRWPNTLICEGNTMNTQIHTIHAWQLEQDAIVFCLLPLIYFSFCYCLKRIVEKVGMEPGFLIWVPLFNAIPMLQAAGLSGWFLILLCVPGVNLIVGLYMWVKICQARGKSGWLVLLIFVPLINIFFIPYMAFSK